MYVSHKSGFYCFSGHIAIDGLLQESTVYHFPMINKVKSRNNESIIFWWVLCQYQPSFDCVYVNGFFCYSGHKYYHWWIIHYYKILLYNTFSWLTELRVETMNQLYFRKTNEIFLLAKLILMSSLSRSNVICLSIWKHHYDKNISACVVILFYCCKNHRQYGPKWSRERESI